MAEFMVPWPPVVTFNFSQATESQKEVLARENAHCSKNFPSLTFHRVNIQNCYKGRIYSEPIFIER